MPILPAVADQEPVVSAERLAGAEAISAKAREIGTQNDLIISECVWDIGTDIGLQHAHRLDIFTTSATVRLYFPDVELLASANEARKKRTEDRLRDAIATLLPRSHGPTYGTSV